MNNKGFGLIELMISIVITSIVCVGLYSVLTSSVLSFGMSSAGNNATGSAYRVNVSLNYYLFQAGFVNYRRSLAYFNWENVESNISDTNTTLDDNKNFPSKAAVIGGRSKDTLATFGDTIKIRFTGASISDDMSSYTDKDAEYVNGYIFDCNGSAVPSTVILEMQFYVDGDGLKCKQSALTDKDNIYKDDKLKPVLIDPSVKMLVLRYSINNLDDADKTKANSYVSYDKISNDSWQYVDNVQFGFVTSQDTKQKMVKVKNDLQLPILDTEFTVPKGDSNLHRVITGNVALVNVAD